MQSQKVVGFLLSRVDCNDGIASHCETLIRGLRNSGWKVILITGKVSFDNSSLKRFQSLKELAEEWIVIDGFRLIPTRGNIFKIFTAIKHHKIQLLHAHGYSLLLFALVCKIFVGVKCVSTFHLLKAIHLGESSEGKSLLFQKFLLQNYLKIFSPNIFIAISSAIEQWLVQDIGINKLKVKKVFNGIDTNYFYPPDSDEINEARAKFNLSKQDFVITLVGRTQWEKGHKLLIDAVNLIAERSLVHSFKCMFAGSGDQKDEIERYALSDENKRNLFVFLGYVNEPRDVYWSSDVIVLPSQAEGFPLVIVESMACGVVPIRTPAAGAYDQIEDGLNGFIIPFDDLEALSDKLLQLAENSDLRSRMVENTIKSSQKFTLEAMTSGTIAAYEEALS